MSHVLGRLQSAIAKGCGESHCLRLWSRFIRLRDLESCIVCDARGRVVAHHILRKSFLYYARFDTGNGVTLCRRCHKRAHATFNGKPDFRMPMDTQEGEKIDLMVALYGALVDDAKKRGLAREDFYYLNNAVLETFKRFQGIPPEYQYPCSRIEQAYYIWRGSPSVLVEALIRANLPSGEPHR